MNMGKTLFAQTMEFIPWTSFARIVERYGGDSRVRSLSCPEQFRAMAFAQLTYRESLRDIETCLLANQTKLYGMGFRSPVKRSTLADANEGRDWHIWADLAALLIRRARKLYCNDSFGIELTNTVYALDATTIDLCLSLFPWAPFRTAKAAVKLHTLLDLRGNIPAFIHISDGKTHEVNVLDMLNFEAGAFYVMDRGYLDFSRLFALHQAGAFFVTRAKRGMDAHRVYSMQVDRSTGIICDQRIALDGIVVSQDYPEQLRRIRFKDPESGKTLVFPTNNFTLLAGKTVLHVDQAVLRSVGKCGEVQHRDRRLGLCPRRHRQETPQPGCVARHVATDFFWHPLLEDVLAASLSWRRPQRRTEQRLQPSKSIRVLIGPY